MIFYGLIGIVKGMQYTYLSANLTTLEKKFGIKSKETAILMSGNEIAQVLFMFFMPLTLKVKRRPLWCAIGLSITALGLYIMALPHFLTGYNLLENLVESDKEKESQSGEGLCKSEVHLNSLEGVCGDDGSRVIDWFGLVIVFLGIALTGIGNSLFYVFGMVYLDDNSSKRNSPFLLSLTFVFRLIGPTLGFMLGARCLTLYVFPGEDPGFDEKDPRWIGAWWIGFPIIATLLLMFSLPLVLFPQRLPRAETDAAHEAKASEKLVDDKDKDAFIPAMKRLLSNKLFMYNLGSSVFYVFAFMGFGTFMPKYMEFQFRITASGGARMSATAGTASKAIGLLLSGWLIGKFKFSARTLAAWNVFLGALFFSCLIIFAMVGCSTSQMYGAKGEAGTLDINVGCNDDCGCPVSRMSPICSKDGITNFYSACHAGCMGVVDTWASEGLNTTVKGKERSKGLVYQNCSCVEAAAQEFNRTLSQHWIAKDVLTTFSHPPPLQVLEETQRSLLGTPVTEAVSGWCEVPGCDAAFKYWIITVGIISIVASTGRVGNVLVALRCVDVKDKSLSFAMNIVSISLFAALPSPVIFGAIIDNTCILWQQECGETTNCLMYDADQLRLYFMLTTASIMVLGVAFDVAVVYYSKDIQIFDPEGERVLGEEELSEEPVLLTRKQHLAVSNQLLYGSHASLTKDAVFKQ